MFYDSKRSGLRLVTKGGDTKPSLEQCSLHQSLCLLVVTYFGLSDWEAPTVTNISLYYYGRLSGQACTLLWCSALTRLLQSDSSQVLSQKIILIIDLFLSKQNAMLTVSVENQTLAGLFGGHHLSSIESLVGFEEHYDRWNCKTRLVLDLKFCFDNDSSSRRSCNILS